VEAAPGRLTESAIRWVDQRMGWGCRVSFGRLRTCHRVRSVPLWAIIGCGRSGNMRGCRCLNHAASPPAGENAARLGHDHANADRNPCGHHFA
jgi:hypothetical protein